MLLSEIFGDLRLSGRALWRSRAFVLGAGATLCLATATLSALGSATYELLLGQPPYAAPQQLAMVWSDLPLSGYSRAPLSGPELIDVRNRHAEFSGVAAIFPSTATLTRDDEPVQITTGTVTSNFFDVLGVRPLLGRTFHPKDEGKGKPPTIVLSWATWQGQFGADPTLIGRRVNISGRQTEIVGVMPPSFRMAFAPDANIPAETAAWMPFAQDLAESPRQRFFIRVFGRLRTETPFDYAATRVEQTGAVLEREFADYAASGRRLFIVPLQADLQTDVRSTSLVLSIGSALLLALAFVNVAGLFAARSIARRKQHAVQRALGATDGRLWRQLASECALLSLIACGVGIALGAVGLFLLQAVRPPSLARLDHASALSPALLSIIIVLAFGTTLIALVVGAGIERTSVSRELRLRGGSGERHPVRSGLIAAQFAVALTIVVVASLLARTAVNVVSTDVGMRPNQVLTFRYTPGPLQLTSAEAVSAYNRGLEDSIRALPGVEAAGTISHLPFHQLPNWSMGYRVDGAAPGNEREADSRPVSPGFLAAVGGRLLEGRFFTESDDLRAQRVVVVDRLLAERAWPGGSAIGKIIHIHTTGGAVPTPFTVVGVVEHMRYRAIELQVREQVFLPVRQFVSGPYAMLIRVERESTALAADVRALVRRLDPRVPVWDVRPLGDYYADAAAERAFSAGVLALFAASALLLAGIGLYGVMASSVESRRPEFGVRLAVGASQTAVRQSVLRQGARYVLAGTLMSVLAGVAAARSINAVLYGVSPLDPWSWLVSIAVLVCAALAACWLPARRASTTDPAMLMRLG